jgi:hypothetical protein
MTWGNRLVAFIPTLLVVLISCIPQDFSGSLLPRNALSYSYEKSMFYFEKSEVRADSTSEYDRMAR